MTSYTSIDALLMYNRANAATCVTVEPIEIPPECKICKVLMRGSDEKLCRPCLDLHIKGLSGMVELREVDMNDDEIREGIRKYRIDWGRDPKSIQVANPHTLKMLYEGRGFYPVYEYGKLYGIPVLHNNKVPSTKVWMV